MEKYKINIIYGEDSLEELIIKSMVKEILTIIDNGKFNDYYNGFNYEYGNK